MSELTLLYLHGFLSSPASAKAVQTRAYARQRGLVDRVLVPALTAGPAATVQQLEQVIADCDHSRLAIIGSSLGGFYATVLAERLSLPAVLINPAVAPHQYWQSYLGVHRNYHTGQEHEVTADHVRELKQLDPPGISKPENYRVFLQRHDEVLDYRQALDRYGEPQCIVRTDGDHAYADFAGELPRAFEFLVSRISPNVR